MSYFNLVYSMIYAQSQALREIGFENLRAVQGAFDVPVNVFGGRIPDLSRRWAFRAQKLHGASQVRSLRATHFLWTFKPAFVKQAQKAISK